MTLFVCSVSDWTALNSLSATRLHPRRKFVRSPQQSFDRGARLAQTRFNQGKFRGSQASQLAAPLIDP
ncbi:MULTISPECIES: hypothetical protein [Streptomyces rochei group]|uniref:Uncharacterized protein n=1 Tax=Streptomyces plicatus TaxID=1922 RepID=A0ABW1Y4N7_STRPL|nr:hypothetical protein [Streptomyces plicatus]